jgi:predicted flap endonuclease-1-like 5' DNA nuclease
MSERFASDLLFILIALIIAAILGFLIGYFLRKPKTIVKEVERDTGRAEPPDAMPDFDAKAARAVLGKNIALNDLKIVEGIGPVIEGILKKNNIDTWKKLAGSNKEEISSILLAEGGEKYRIHDPGSWPRQAELAYKGNWRELKKLQDELLGGRQ